MLVEDWPVTVLPAPALYVGQCAGKAAFGRDLPNHILTFPGQAPHVGQAEEVEAGSIRFRVACDLCHLWAEVYDTCLVRVEREPKAGKTLAQNS